jgi:glycosyltransferase involved in cell wall biosynthesis
LRIPRSEIACIRNGIDLPTLPAERVWKPAGRLRLLYIGRLDPKKGIENLLVALAQPLGVEIELAIYGRGATDYEESLYRLVEELDLGELVHFCGLVDGAEKTRAFFETDFCVLPSFTENFGMVVAEALAHGVPVIASRSTPWAALEAHGCGLWVDNSPESLRAAILQMSKSDLHEMGTKGRIWMEKEFSWSEIGLCMEAVYRRLASKTLTEMSDMRG